MVDLSNMFLNPTSSSAWSKPSLFTHGTRLADAPPKHYAEVQQPLHDLWDDYESMTPTERTAASTMISRATSFSSVSSSVASSKQLEKLQPESKAWIPELCPTGPYSVQIKDLPAKEAFCQRHVNPTKPSCVNWLHLQTSAFLDARQPIVQPITPRTLSPDVEHFVPSPPATPPISPRSLSPDVEHFGQSTSCSMKAPSEGRQPTVPPITPRTLSPDVERFAQGLNQQRGSLSCVDVPADSLYVVLSSTGNRMGRCNSALSKPESKPCGFFMLFTH